MSIAINDNFERDQYVASFTGQVNFVYSFPIFSETYLTVYKYAAADTPDDPTQKLILGVDYTVSGVGEAAGGSITLTVGATIGDVITIVGTEPIERTTVFQDLNPFTVALNQQLNQMTVMLQQVFTYWANITPHYNYDELVSSPTADGFNAGVRPFKLILPMLPDGHVWVGRGQLGSIPDDITTQFIGGAGTGNVLAAHAGMRASIVLWTGTDFIVTDSDLNIAISLITPTAGADSDQVGFDNTWGAMHWPAHNTAGRPPTPSDGDTYYDNGTNQFFGFINGVWVPFGTGGNNAVIQTIVRANTFNPKDWVTVDDTGAYVLALADTPANDDVIGVVTDATATQFTIQQSGYNETLFTGLDVTNHNYFLSTTNPGQMINADASINGQVSRPVFTADSATAGWVLPYRPLVVGGSGGGGGGGSGTNPDVVTVTYTAHPFVGGEAIRASTPSGGEERYVLADATTYLNSVMVGFVIQKVNANQFIYQTSGVILDDGTQAGPILDDVGATLVPGTPYYLSTVPGKITSTEPSTPNFSRPAYMPVATVATVGYNRGVIWEERSIGASSPPPPVNPTIVQTNSPVPFVTTDPGWIDTGICATITIDENTDHILILASLDFSSNGQNGAGFRITRNGVPIDTGTPAGSRTPASGATHTTQFALDSGLALFETFYDLPGLAGTYTYCIEVNKGNNTGVAVNAGFTDTDAANFFRTASSLILMIIE